MIRLSPRSPPCDPLESMSTLFRVFFRKTTTNLGFPVRVPLGFLLPPWWYFVFFFFHAFFSSIIGPTLTFSVPSFFFRKLAASLFSGLFFSLYYERSTPPRYAGAPPPTFFEVGHVFLEVGVTVLCFPRLALLVSLHLLLFAAEISYGSHKNGPRVKFLSFPPLPRHEVFALADYLSSSSVSK